MMNSFNKYRIKDLTEFLPNKLVREKLINILPQQNKMQKGDLRIFFEFFLSEHYLLKKFFSEIGFVLPTLRLNGSKYQ